MILDIDAGNSSLKWRLSQRDGVIVQRGVCFDESELEGLEVGGAVDKTLERIRVGSVRGDGFASALTEIARRCWQLAPEFALPVRHCAGVTNAYKVPHTLGVDRWLAILAAFNHCRGACCVVDAGSAATFDVVAEDGRHLGGYIVPGLVMQKRSLLEGTAIRLSGEAGWPDDLRPGTDTSLAVHGGIIAMLVDWVQREYQEAARVADSALYLTGGDALLLSAHLLERGIAHTVVRDLVLDGLASALP
ncbi:MAG: hypothetical protein A3H44_15005 [Gammaproteobacteria bacterium RIFCSPLOWO2_02_FULL_57_10]|nr:MAG: hypothetical protein A3H44_15005 [Gammaproteobacteria bacterium RIFCSPLOWO2_02_FULL_57_10]